VLRENRPATLHFFLNVCTGLRPSTVLTVLSVYLTGLAVLNVYCTDALQYSFVSIFLMVDITASVVDACSLLRSMVLVLV
jgi:hypothetical protein